MHAEQSGNGHSTIGLSAKLWRYIDQQTLEEQGDSIAE